MHKNVNLIKNIRVPNKESWIKNQESRIPGLLYSIFIIYYKFVYLPCVTRDN